VEIEPADDRGIGRLLKEAANLLGLKYHSLPVIAPRPKTERSETNAARR